MWKGRGKIYINGILNDSVDNVDGRGVANITEDLLFADDDATVSEKLKGILDEVHISKSVRSADWIVSEFNNQNDTTIDSANFISNLGDESSSSSSSVSTSSSSSSSL